MLGSSAFWFHLPVDSLWLEEAMSFPNNVINEYLEVGVMTAQETLMPGHRL